MNSLQKFYTFPHRLARFVRKSPAGRRLAIRESIKAALRSFNQQISAAAYRTYDAINPLYRRRRIFREAYSNHLWGSDPHTQFFSGVGSRGEAVEVYANQMARLLEQHAAELGRPLTVVDLGCGDFQVGYALLTRVPELTYIGCDIVPEVIEYNRKTYANERISFHRLDIVADPLPKGDVCLVRQVLQHLSNAEIMRFLQRANYEYLYITEGQPAIQEGPINPDKATSADIRFDWSKGHGRGVELDKPPYTLVTREAFRVHAFPTEVIVTQRIFRQPWPVKDVGGANQR
jgi:SAM-dependent methyltransferase